MGCASDPPSNGMIQTMTVTRHAHYRSRMHGFTKPTVGPLGQGDEDIPGVHTLAECGTKRRVRQWRGPREKRADWLAGRHGLWVTRQKMPLMRRRQLQADRQGLWASHVGMVGSIHNQHLQHGIGPNEADGSSHHMKTEVDGARTPCSTGLRPQVGLAKRGTVALSKPVCCGCLTRGGGGPPG